jgi:hypothetical protein
VIAFTNTSRFPTPLLRKLLDWTLAERSAAACVSAVHFGNDSRAYHGWCKPSGRIRVRVGGPEHFPCAVKYPGLKTAPEYTIADPIEALVVVIAHEAHHAKQFERRHAWTRAQKYLIVTGPAAAGSIVERARTIGAGTRPPISEIEAEHAAIVTLGRFREVREALGLDAVVARVAEKHEKLVAQRERAAALTSAKKAEAASPAAKRVKVLAAIKAWETKAKRAATALKKYHRRLARLDKLIGGAS